MSRTFSAQELKEKAGRLRVLIVGRANSGKTTILKKICNTMDDPELYDGKGGKVRVEMFSCPITHTKM